MACVHFSVALFAKPVRLEVLVLLRDNGTAGFLLEYLPTTTMLLVQILSHFFDRFSLQWSVAAAKCYDARYITQTLDRTPRKIRMLDEKFVNQNIRASESISFHLFSQLPIELRLHIVTTLFVSHPYGICLSV